MPNTFVLPQNSPVGLFTIIAACHQIFTPTLRRRILTNCNVADCYRNLTNRKGEAHPPDATTNLSSPLRMAYNQRVLIYGLHSKSKAVKGP